MRILLLILTGYIGYKLGYDRSKKIQTKYRVLLSDQSGKYYLVVDDGQLLKTQDQSQANLFTYFESKQLVDLLKLYSPEYTYKIEEENLYINA